MWRYKLTKLQTLEKIKIDPGLLDITVSDEEIFARLQSLTTYIVPVKKAERDDIVLAFVIGEKIKKEISFSVGKGYYPEYEQAITGLKVGGTAHVNGETLIVSKINRVVVPPVSNTAVKSLRLGDVKTVEEFKEYYILKNGDEIRKRLIDKLYRGIVNQVVSIIQPEVSDEAVSRAFTERKQKLLAECDGDERLYEVRLEHDLKKSDIAANEAALRENCLMRLKQVAAGAAFAAEDGEAREESDSFYLGYLRTEIGKYLTSKMKLRTEVSKNE